MQNNIGFAGAKYLEIKLPGYSGLLSWLKSTSKSGSQSQVESKGKRKRKLTIRLRNHAVQIYKIPSYYNTAHAPNCKCIGTSSGQYRCHPACPVSADTCSGSSDEVQVGGCNCPSSIRPRRRRLFRSRSSRGCYSTGAFGVSNYYRKFAEEWGIAALVLEVNNHSRRLSTPTMFEGAKKRCWRILTSPCLPAHRRFPCPWPHLPSVV
jgi:hypothetical protein